MSIKAIETVYKGYKFRSRLEARWAVFFDELGLEWQYEVEGFEFGGEKYLPDFWFPKFQLWLEIKPNKDELISFAYRCKMRAFSIESEKPLIIIQGEPYQWAFNIIVFPETLPIWTAGFTSFSFIDFYAYAADGNFDTYILSILFLTENQNIVGGVTLGLISKLPNIEQAYTAARQARFENRCT